MRRARRLKSRARPRVAWLWLGYKILILSRAISPGFETNLRPWSWQWNWTKSGKVMLVLYGGVVRFFFLWAAFMSMSIDGCVCVYFGLHKCREAYLSYRWGHASELIATGPNLLSTRPWLSRSARKPRVVSVVNFKLRAGKSTDE